MSAIELDRGLIHAVEAVTEVGGVVAFGPTKTHENRVVAFPQVLAEQLRLVTWRRRFSQPAFAQINTARRDSGSEATVDFPKVNPHDLRHTAASVPMRGGASVVGVQRVLGHADVKMTLNTYVGLFTSDLTAVANVLKESANSSKLAGALNPHADETVEL